MDISCGSAECWGTLKALGLTKREQKEALGFRFWKIVDWLFIERILRWFAKQKRRRIIESKKRVRRRGKEKKARLRGKGEKKGDFGWLRTSW